MRRPRLTMLGVLAAVALLVPASASAQSKGSPQPRIVGGNTASISQYPWQAAVVLSSNGEQFCGGSLITSRIVLTAGHCVFDTDPDCSTLCGLSDPGGDHTPMIDPNNVDVILGSTTVSGGQRSPITDVMYQSNYDPNYQGDGVPRFDLGYLVLGAASAQTPIKIADSSAQSLWAPGSPVDVSGWGSTNEFGSPVDTLRAATVNIVPDPSCAADYTPDFDASTMVCAAAPGKDSCFGDSGGPLQAPQAGGGYLLVGVTGWGDGCAQPNAPGVYTRVAGPTMAALVESDVSLLESKDGLPAEGIFAGLTTTPTAGATPKAKAKAKHPFAKCKRIRNKKKRARCVKKVKRKLKRA